MFVRTKEGKILKCFKSESMNLPIYYVIGMKTNSYVEYQDVKKVSENIIDIVEVGDYVNGFIVNDIVKENEDIRFNLVGQLEPYLHNEDIKTIVTKEQFEAMKYEVSK